MPCTCTGEVLGSNLGPYIGYQSLRPYTRIALRLSHDHFLPNPLQTVPCHGNSVSVLRPHLTQ
jgi:hypothetical protein